jgi:V/A-type H+-transporting ATPase subunit D
MRSLGRIPPGRSGRLWLTRRLEAAERGRDQLDRKLRILTLDLQRTRLLADRAGTEWREALREADAWLLRAALLGGQDAVRGAAAPHLVEVSVTWVTDMGVTYPAEVEPVAAFESDHLDGNAALAPARSAFRIAVLAGARCAAAEEAVRRVEQEIALTRRRLRALQKRWIPWLEDELRERELLLAQAEQEDGVRARRVAGPLVEEVGP